MGLLFADVVHYSLLTEDQISPFMQHFLGAVADLLERLDDAPVMKSTWGDAVYFVFSHVRHAGNFALELCEFTGDYVGQTPWAKGYSTFPTYHVRRRQISYSTSQSPLA